MYGAVWNDLFPGLVKTAATYAIKSAEHSYEAQITDDLQKHMLASKTALSVAEAYKTIAEAIVECIEKEFERWYFDGVSGWMEHYNRSIKLSSLFLRQSDNHLRYIDKVNNRKN